MMIVLPPTRLLPLLRADALNVSRDPILMLGVVMVLIPPALLAVFGAQIDAAASDAFGLDRPSIILGACTLALSGALIGWVAGFLLLEDRDDNVLLALEITPIGKTGFIAYRLTAAFTLTFLAALAGAFLALPHLGPLEMIGAALLAGLHAIATALFLLAFAANKVEGLALTKLVNITILAPALALLPLPWRYGAGILPPVWMGEVVGLPASPLPAPLAIAISALLYTALIAWLTRRVSTRLG